MVFCFVQCVILCSIVKYAVYIAPQFHVQSRETEDKFSPTAPAVTQEATARIVPGFCSKQQV